VASCGWGGAISTVLARAPPPPNSSTIFHGNSGSRYGRITLVPRCNVTAVPACSKTAISAGTCRPKSTSIIRGTDGSNPLSLQRGATCEPRRPIERTGRRSRAPTPPGPDKLSSSPAPGDSPPCRGLALIFTATSASKADIALFKHDLPLLLSLLFDRAAREFRACISARLGTRASYMSC